MSSAKSSPGATPGPQGRSDGGAKKSDPCSRTAADQAVDLLLNLHERERTGKLVDAEFVAMAKGVDLREDDLPKAPPSPLVQVLLENPVVLQAAAAAAGAAVLYGLFVLLSPLWSSHHVAGTIFINRAAAQGVEITLYSAAGDKVSQAVSAAGGAYHVGGLGLGDFTVTAKRLEGEPKFPDVYGSPHSTPWRIKLEKSLDAVMLYATDPPQKPAPPQPRSDD